MKRASDIVPWGNVGSGSFATDPVNDRADQCPWALGIRAAAHLTVINDGLGIRFLRISALTFAAHQPPLSGGRLAVDYRRMFQTIQRKSGAQRALGNLGWRQTAPAIAPGST